MSSVHTTRSGTPHSSLLALKRVPVLAAGAFVFTTLMFAAPVTAQTTTTAAGATTTVAGVTTTAAGATTTAAAATSTTLAPTDTTTVGPVVTADSTAVAEEVVDTAVPAGGVDAGLGGTASDGGNGLVLPVLAGAVVVVGFAARRMSRARRAN